MDALKAETVRLDDLHGRVLAEDIRAPIDVPSFDRAAMDGYALPCLLYNPPIADLTPGFT